MSVRQWKRVITITVIIIIILFSILALVFGLKSCHYSNLEDDGKLINLDKYGTMDAEELSGLFDYMGSINSESDLSYKELYPNLYVDNTFDFVKAEAKTCYITFDDAPDASVTPQILDILSANNIKATFFVVYDDSPEAEAIYRRIVNEGHTIGVHSASHNFEYVYSSVEAYLEDFEKMATHIENTTGVKPDIFRFIGGSINKYNVDNYREIISEMVRRGYVYYDWNVSSGDEAVSYVSSDEIIKNVEKGTADKNQVILLMHAGDGNNATITALPEVIKTLKNQGYDFASLNSTITPYCFGY